MEKTRLLENSVGYQKEKEVKCEGKDEGLRQQIRKKWLLLNDIPDQEDQKLQ